MSPEPSFGDGAVDITGNLTLSGGVLTLGYSGGAAGVNNDPDNPADANSGSIDFVVAESRTPEPSTYALMSLAFGVTGFMLRLRRKQGVEGLAAIA